MPAKVDPEKCTGCENCIENCPVECITLEDGKAVVDAEECTDCEACVEDCDDEAIEMLD